MADGLVAKDLLGRDAELSPDALDVVVLPRTGLPGHGRLPVLSEEPVEGAHHPLRTGKFGQSLLVAARQ